MMKMRTNIILLSAFAGIFGILAASCGDEPDMQENVKPDDAVREVYALNFSGTARFDGDMNDGRAMYAWPDGATICLRGENIVKTGNDYAYAVYNYESGWKLYNFTGNEMANATCSVYYREGATVDDYKTDSEYYLNTQCSYLGSGIFSFDGTVAELEASLSPRWARLRFASATMPDDEIQYNYAKNYTDYNGLRSVNGAETDVLHFTYDENAGMYMSQYLYVINVPVLKIDNYVYKYKNKSTCAAGSTGYIMLPTGTSDPKWTSEAYTMQSYKDLSISMNWDIPGRIFLPGCTSVEQYFYSNVQCVHRIDFDIAASWNVGTRKFYIVGAEYSLSEVGHYCFNSQTLSSPSSTYFYFFTSSSPYTLNVKINSYIQSNF